MNALLTPHKISIVNGTETKTYFFLVNPKTYQGISTKTGIQEISNEAEKAEPRYPVSELLRCLKVERLVIYYQVSGKRRAAQILCAPNKSLAFCQSGAGTHYRGGEIISVMRVRKAFYF